jgi:hypothetical protein
MEKSGSLNWIKSVKVAPDKVESKSMTGFRTTQLGVKLPFRVCVTVAKAPSRHPS